ncbi:MAG TPA: M28 family peptidase [Candidatus Kapabacteria bacterium]|jgi:Zn-dependent M28 family amino/carboxypeptidase|nr:M28 family peptidase [Candidatus Kapabacteria bacterium]
MPFRRSIRALLVLALLSLAVWYACKKEVPQETPPASAIPSKPVPAFNAERAFKDIETQVGFGPRVPNTSPHEKELEFLRTTLLACTPSVQLQSFTSAGYKPGESLKLTNVIASFNDSAKDRVLILTHWDSRPWADEDPNPANHDKPVPAANDGGSGTAVMLELARLFKDNPPPIGVDLLFDDGEDYGKYKVDSLDRYFLGVKYFVKTKPTDYNPRFAILLDMVGDKNAVFQPEMNSVQNAPAFTSEIWRTAESLGLTDFKSGQGQDIEDDHFPLIQAGIPSVDIIDGPLVGHMTSDQERQYWHTVDDLPKHLSPATLEQVGRLLLTLIYDRLPRDFPTL